ncbi:MAG: glycosyltransferase, partial [Gammaproteobacteria bacterium]
HVTHSWGGGVATWVDACIAADRGGRHLQLRSEGPQSGEGAGQRLALYAGRQLDAPLASWWLQPAIDAVDADNEQYRQVLAEILRRFGVARVIVSSLVGHSLDALRTGRPTVQVLHDHFPAWPLLSIHPSEYGGDLAAAMDDRRAREQFGNVPLEQWRSLADAYREAAAGVRLAAPSRSVIDLQRSLVPGWADREIALIPHGLPPLPGAAPVAAKPRADGRLRLLIPGRVQSGKGADLLDRALDDLRPLAQIYLLGTGKGGERYFGRAGVNVVVDYQRDDLARLVADIGPDCAALLSVVPETFSYTLSEMRALAVPVIATRLGSFAERIDDGVDGWLIEPRARALVEQLAKLAAEPALLAQARNALAKEQPRSMEDMLQDYQRLCPAASAAPGPAPRGQLLAEAQAGSWRDIARRAERSAESAREGIEQLKRRVVERTDWALALSDEIASLRGELDAGQAMLDRQERELAERARHMESLAADIERQGAHIRDQFEQLGERARHIETLDSELADLERRLDLRNREFDGLQSRHETLQELQRQILNSRSWRLTRPLRAGRRMYANFRRVQGWNPLRWPLLLGVLGRKLSTVGLRGTLIRMQQVGREETPERTLVETAPAGAPVEIPAAVPCSDEPRVSIVIPAYNHLDHTAACLASIGRARCDTPLEVIVVDDASAEEPPEPLEAIDGLRLLRNEENRGFIHTCNRGAEAARGEFVVFLNNDTEVQDGWLEALLEVFETRPDAGLVGSRLLYPDGTLQECGGIVFRDGSGWNYGRGADPDDPQYRFLREADYCSGACIMIRARLFAELGGFDAHYAPAYYEDTDLAFRVRERGLRVYVQPDSTVVHHEGVTSGTDIGSGTKRYQQVNQGKFRERWAEALRRQPAPIVDPRDVNEIRAARDHRLHGRVLVVDAYAPEPDQDSGSVRLTQLMRCLQDMGFGVSFLPDNRAYAGRYTRALQSAGVEAWYDPWLGSPQDFLARHGAGFSHVMVSRHYVAVNYLAAVRRHAPQARFIFDTVDLHYLREQRLAELEGKPALVAAARQTRKSELGVIRDADATLVVSPVEREVLARDAPGAAVHILSNIHEVHGRSQGFDGRRDLYFVGGFQHPPNIDAVEWFISDIWPRVHAALPEARFHVVGSKAPDTLRQRVEAHAGEGVVFHGFVEDLEPFLAGCRLSVAPLRYGAGVKGKVNQSMSHGQPVVATSVAVEGLDAEHGREALIADEAADFADAVVRLYGDRALWERISEHGIENVRRHFSVEAARRDLETLFTALEEGQA